MNSESLKWGILGTSFISGVMADAIVAEGSGDIYAVAGRSPEPRQAMVEKYGITRVYDTMDACIADPDVDIIYIALPNHLHCEYVIKAAQAKKAILCEKSLTVDMPTAQQAMQAVADNGVFFLEGLMYLTHPLAGVIAQQISRGCIGTVKSIHGQYCAAISEFTNPGSKGALYNLGCYPMSLLHLVMQQAFGDDVFTDLKLQANGRLGKDGNVCESSVMLDFANGVKATLHTAEDYGLYASFKVLGDKGDLTLLSNPWLPEASGNQIQITPYEGEPEVIDVAGDGDAFVHQVKVIKACLANGQTQASRPAATHADSLAIMALLTQWQTAAEA